MKPGVARALVPAAPEKPSPPRYIVLLVLAATLASAAPADPEQLIEAGHWKQARTLVEARLRESPSDALSTFLLSQIRNAFGDRESPLPLAEKAVALDGKVAKYHRQVAECLGVMAQHSNPFQQVFLARRFRKEIDAALALDPRDTQATRDLMEFYLLAPGIIGGDTRKAAATADHLCVIDPVEGLLAQSRLATFRQLYGEAVHFLRRAAEIQPPSYRALIALARHDPGAGERAMALDPARADAYAILAEFHASRAEWPQLDAILAASARQAPDDLAPFYAAAERLLTTGADLPRAERYLRAYLSQPPEGNRPSAADARSRLSRVLEKEGRTITPSNASLPIGPENPRRPN